LADYSSCWLQQLVGCSSWSAAAGGCSHLFLFVYLFFSNLYILIFFEKKLSQHLPLKLRFDYKKETSA
jgi:hypothetical protein